MVCACFFLHAILLIMNQSLLIAVVIAGVFYIAGQQIVSQGAPGADDILTVQATGVAKNVPTLAYITLGVQVQAKATAQEATDTLANQGNAVLDAMKKLGIAEADLKTQNISVQPSYNYLDGRQTLRGYEGSQQIEVTIRDTKMSGDVIARATEAGANQVGGVSFKSEDPEVQQLAAEQDAIANARKKAEDLADALGVRLGKVKNYSAQPSYGSPMPYALEAKAMGGDTVTSPQVPAGTQETQATVTVTYEIK